MREIRKTAEGKFRIQTSKGEICGKRCILAAGGSAAPKTGSDGSGYALARSFGHTVRKPLPALVPLLSPEPWLPEMAGVRAQASVHLEIDGKTVFSDTGEVQFTKEGISGIPVFQISRFASVGLNEGRSVTARIDFLPEISPEHLRRILRSQVKNLRLSEYRIIAPDNKCMERQKSTKKYGDASEYILSGSGKTWNQILAGLVHQKIANMITGDLKPANVPAAELPEKTYRKQMDIIVRRLKDTSVRISAAGTFAQAQVTCGGILLDEIGADMQSKLVTDLYFAGEILDVDGICGGYNLQWAWTSGFLAGSNAGKI